MRYLKNLSVITVAAFCALLVSTPVVRANPSMVSASVALSPLWAVYVLVDGVLLDVSEDASYGEGQVYLAGVALGTVTASGLIVGANGAIVGFVAPANS